MKTYFTVAWFIVASMAHADERIAVKAASGRFVVTQEYKGDRDKGEGEFVEAIRYRDAAFPVVRLLGKPWPGDYYISPDECWMVRIQKIASGESIGILYRLENNGRVSEVLGFDELLWKISDQTSALKKEALFHTEVAAVYWSKNSDVLEVVLHGSAAASRDGKLESRVTYNLETHKASIKKTKVIPPEGPGADRS